MNIKDFYFKLQQIFLIFVVFKRDIKGKLTIVVFQ